jgi:PAS domain S-box-containing protein
MPSLLSIHSGKPTVIVGPVNIEPPPDNNFVRRASARPAQGQLIALVDHSPDLIAQFDREYRHLFINSEIERISGMPRAHFIGRSNDELGMPPDRVAIWHDAIDRIFAGESEVRIQFTFNALDAERFFESRLAPDHDSEGQVRSVVAVTRDVTESRLATRALAEAKERAEEIARLKSVILKNLSHEIRTPLTSIIGFAELLLRQGGDDHREFAGAIARNGQRLLNTLSSVLDLAQLESGDVFVISEVVDLRDLVEQVANDAAEEIEKKGLLLRVDAPDLPVLIRVDRSMMVRVLENLVGNAIKFTRQGEILLQIRAGAEETIVDVIDSGIGILPSALSHIFDEFRQGSEGTRRSHEGNGLGLAISRRLMLLMNGTIEVESEIGRGSRFSVRLPLAEVA